MSYGASAWVAYGVILDEPLSDDAEESLPRSCRVVTAGNGVTGHLEHAIIVKASFVTVGEGMLGCSEVFFSRRVDEGWDIHLEKACVKVGIAIFLPQFILGSEYA